MPLLSLRDIDKSFGAHRVLRGVSFDVEAGEVHALLGANGAGKSTLIKILSGAYRRDGGEVRIDGKPVALRTPQEALALGIGVIYQEFHLVPELTVAENLLIGQEPVRRLAGVPLLSRRALREAARRHLETLDFPLDPDRRIKELATGEKQLVEIAKALYRRVRILVLDEPTAALSRRETRRLFAIMRDLQSRGLGLIYISHHLEEVFEVADRISVLRDGRNVGTWRREAVTEAELVRAMVGRDVSAGERAAGRSADGVAGEVVLETRGLGGAGFREVSLQLRRGEILALTGAAGAGQAELLWALAGAAPILEGELRLCGRPARWRSLREAARAGVRFAPGDRKSYGIFPALDVETNFTFAELPKWSRWGVLNRSAVRRAALERIVRYGVRCTGPEQEMQALSGGNQQKIIVGRVAEQGAEVYLFDEPTRGVDVGAREEIYGFLGALAARGAGVVVATPDIQEALRLGDRIAVMRQGRIVYEAAAEAADEPSILGAILGAEGAEAARALQGGEGSDSEWGTPR